MIMDAGGIWDRDLKRTSTIHVDGSVLSNSSSSLADSSSSYDSLSSMSMSTSSLDNSKDFNNSMSSSSYPSTSSLTNSNASYNSSTSSLSPIPLRREASSNPTFTSSESSFAEYPEVEMQTSTSHMDKTKHSLPDEASVKRALQELKSCFSTASWETPKTPTEGTGTLRVDWPLELEDCDGSSCSLCCIDTALAPTFSLVLVGIHSQNLENCVVVAANINHEMIAAYEHAVNNHGAMHHQHAIPEDKASL